MATYTLSYATAAEVDVDPESLATSSTRTAGVESAVIDNTTNLYVDALVAGKITTGTSPTVSKVIEVWVYGVWHDGSSDVYPDVIDGTKSAETITSENVKAAALKLGAVIVVDSTSDRVYYVAPFSVAALFGGVMPRKWGIFIAHDTGVNLNSTASNHAFYYTGVKYASA